MLKINRNWLFFPVMATGILLLFFAVKSRPTIPINPALSKARPVDVVSLSIAPFAPLVTGFGRVTPKRGWQGIAEVSGKVIYRNPQLEKGQILAKNTLLLKIDPTDYQIAVAKANADLSAIEAKLAKLTLDKKSIQTRLNTEKRRLRLREKELERQRNLLKRGLSSPSALDNEQQAFYAQQTQVQELESRLTLLPSEQKMANAENEAAKLALAQAKRNLEKTELSLPVTSRIAAVNIEEDQVVTINQMMVESHGLGAVEVEAQVSIHDMQLLFASLDTDINSDFSAKLKELSAKVTLSSGSFSRAWEAKVARLSDTVDSNQATVGVILEVVLENEQEQGALAKPSLVNGMFVKAQISGKPSPHYVVPERALRGDRLYFINDGKLIIMPVTVLFRREQHVAVLGDFTKMVTPPLLVVNDLIPALDGMLLDIVTLDGRSVLSEVAK